MAARTCTSGSSPAPEGQAQLFGSWLVVWDDLLPEYPADVADADATVVADSLVTSFGGSRSAVLAKLQTRKAAVRDSSTKYGHWCTQ